MVGGNWYSLVWREPLRSYGCFCCGKGEGLLLNQALRGYRGFISLLVVCVEEAI